MNKSNKQKYTAVRRSDHDDDDESVNNAERGTSSIISKLQSQDLNLDALSSSVMRLGELSLNISKEIDVQNKMLDRLETEVTEATDRTNTLTEKTKELVKKSGGVKSFSLIVFLIIILIFLILLVIYT